MSSWNSKISKETSSSHSTMSSTSALPTANIQQLRADCTVTRSETRSNNCKYQYCTVYREIMPEQLVQFAWPVIRCNSVVTCYCWRNLILSFYQRRWWWCVWRLWSRSARKFCGDASMQAITKGIVPMCKDVLMYQMPSVVCSHCTPLALRWEPFVSSLTIESIASNIWHGCVIAL